MDERQEVRDSAIQTILGMIDDIGDRLSPRAWETIMRTVALDMLQLDVEKLRRIVEQTQPDSQEHHQDSTSSSTILLAGIARIFAGYFDHLSGLPQFMDLWHTFFVRVLAICICSIKEVVDS